MVKRHASRQVIAAESSADGWDASYRQGELGASMAECPYDS